MTKVCTINSKWVSSLHKVQSIQILLKVSRKNPKESKACIQGTQLDSKNRPHNIIHLWTALNLKSIDSKWINSGYPYYDCRYLRSFKFSEDSRHINLVLLLFRSLKLRDCIWINYERDSLSDSLILQVEKPSRRKRSFLLDSGSPNRLILEDYPPFLDFPEES